MEKTIIVPISLHLMDHAGNFVELPQAKVCKQLIISGGFKVVSNVWQLTSKGNALKFLSRRTEYYIRGVEVTAKEIITRPDTLEKSKRVLSQLLRENVGQEDKLVFICNGIKYFLKTENVHVLPF